MAEHRKSLHGNLTNRVLSYGTTIHTERLSYTAFQRLFGRSVRDRAPGGFIQQLRRKADSAGGVMLEVSTRTTALSQTCVCGARARKPLSQRHHHCPGCGFTAQRDVLSAFLVRHVHRTVNSETEAASDWLDVPAARKAVGLRQDIGVRPASSLAFNNQRVLVPSGAGHIPEPGGVGVGRPEPGDNEPAPTATHEGGGWRQRG